MQDARTSCPSGRPKWERAGQAAATFGNQLKSCS